MKWQPIETAPKDGTHILTWSPLAPKYGFKQCRMNVWRERLGGWAHTNPQYWPPTHWMPLPGGPDEEHS